MRSANATTTAAVVSPAAIAPTVSSIGGMSNVKYLTPYNFSSCSVLFNCSHE
jgi:hypothetical protein